MRTEQKEHEIEKTEGDKTSHEAQQPKRTSKKTAKSRKGEMNARCPVQQKCPKQKECRGAKARQQNKKRKRTETRKRAKAQAAKGKTTKNQNIPTEGWKEGNLNSLRQKENAARKEEKTTRKIKLAVGGKK